MSDDVRLAELLDRWEEAQERGEPLSPEELCTECPELLEAVRRQVAALRQIDARLQTHVTHGEETPGGKPPRPFGGATNCPTDGKGDPASEALVMHPEFAELKFHAKGGLGAIYLATDTQIHRPVVLKFIHRRLAGDEESRKRFLLEAEVTGRLEHPGVVPVYGLGQTSGGRPFYAMQYIRGETLEAAIGRFHAGGGSPRCGGERTLEFRNLLGRFVALCRTIAYAHNRGIIHQDVKPENVMLGRYGETLLVDWGLAVPVERDERFKQSGEKTLMPSSGSQSGTSSGSGAGTPPYMSPERTSGLEPTPAGDVYSLGVTLYKILSGRTPFENQLPHQIKQNVIDGRFARPSQLEPHVARPLEAVCLKAMALQARDRYGTAEELAQDVESYLADEPVSAYRERRFERLARWARRHRTAVRAGLLGLCGVILVALVSAVWLVNLAGSEKEARLVAERAGAAAERSRREGLRISARLAGQTIAQDTDLRWRILEAAANSPKLREMLERINVSPRDQHPKDDPDCVELQSWLYERYLAQSPAAKCTSWFVNSADGTQIARVPKGDSIGRNYAYRDYFHGRGYDLPTDEAQGVGPLEKSVHMSAVFESTVTKNLMVVFSVPVWSEETQQGRSIGVLTMTVQLGDFDIPRNTIVVDTREDRLEGVAKSGLVLHHPGLGLRSHEKLPPRLDRPWLDHALKLRSIRRSDDRISAQGIDPLVEDFRDPLAGESGGPWLAAFEPVFVKGRNDTGVADTGWVVIVEDRKTLPR